MKLEIDIHKKEKLISQPRCLKVQETVVGKYIIAVPLFSTVNCKYTILSGTYFFVHLDLQLAKTRQRLVSLGTALDSGWCSGFRGSSSAILKPLESENI